MVKVIKTVKTNKHQITYLKFETDHPKLPWEIAIKFEYKGSYRDPEFLVKRPHWNGYEVYEGGAWDDKHMVKNKLDYAAFENDESMEVLRMRAEAKRKADAKK
tara:strand:- start:1041 stop:1349 length:309 start_codon:yes stop_codon:yes gene_type:complete